MCVSQVQGNLASVTNRQDDFANQFQTLTSAVGTVTTDVKRDIAYVTREQGILKSDLTSVKQQQSTLTSSIETISEQQSSCETQVQADLTTIRSEQTSIASAVQGKTELVKDSNLPISVNYNIINITY